MYSTQVPRYRISSYTPLLSETDCDDWNQHATLRVRSVAGTILIMGRRLTARFAKRRGQQAPLRLLARGRTHLR